MSHLGFQKNTKGFTLIELLVVVSIIGLLSSVVLASLNSARIKAGNATRVNVIGEYYKAFFLFYYTYDAFPWDNGVPGGSEICLSSTTTNCGTPPFPISTNVINALSPYIKLGPAFDIFEGFDSGVSIGPLVGPRYQCEIANGNLCTRGYFIYYVKGNQAQCGWGAHGTYQFDNGTACNLYFPGAPDGCDLTTC